MSATVYALVDPAEQSLIKYIGRTQKPLFIRLCEHVTSPRSAAYAWARELIYAGRVPLIFPIRSGVPVSAVRQAEAEEITAKLATGHQLLNIQVPGRRI